MRAGSRAGRLEQAQPGQVQPRSCRRTLRPDSLQRSHTVPGAVEVGRDGPFLRRYLRAIGHLSNGVDPMEPNAEFADELEKAAGALEGSDCRHCGPAAQWTRVESELGAPWSVVDALSVAGRRRRKRRVADVRDRGDPAAVNLLCHGRAPLTVLAAMRRQAMQP